MKRIILIFSLVCSFQVFSQTRCDIQNHYGDFMKISKKNHNGKEYLAITVVGVDTQYCFANYVNRNSFPLYSLWCECCPSYKQDNLIQIEDSLALQSAFTAVLQNDSVFNSTMQEITAKVIDKTIPKDTITMNTLLNTAVKYFYVLKITEDGYYVGKVCGGLNGIAETETIRKPFIETFALASIIEHYTDEEYNMYNELVNVTSELYKINLGLDNKERLLRARGAVFMQMFYNQKLRDMLRYEYEQQKEYLTFVLRGETSTKKE